MKACSFLPAATRIIQDLGLENFLYGVTFECPIERPRVVRSVLKDRQLTSGGIDDFVRQARAKGELLYYLDAELLNSISPDVIFTQDVCSVCQIDTATAESLCAKLSHRPSIVSLTPSSLAEVFGNIRTIAETLDAADKGDRLLGSLDARLEAIRGVFAKTRVPLCRVALLEWIDPIYNSGHWIPEQVSLAGGADALAQPNEYSQSIEWAQVLSSDPEVLVIAPCGFDVMRALSESEAIKLRPGWQELTAVRSGRAYAVDSTLFTEPGSGLVRGVELLTALFHPSMFELTPTLAASVRPLAASCYR